MQSCAALLASVALRVILETRCAKHSASRHTDPAPVTRLAVHKRPVAVQLLFTSDNRYTHASVLPNGQCQMFNKYL